MTCPKLIESKSNQANNMLIEFVQHFANIYGSTSVTYNVHNLLHLNETVKEFGNLANLTAYPFENSLQSIKRAVKKPHQIEQQLHNIYSKISLFDSNKAYGFKRNLKRESKIISYSSSFGTFTTKAPDNYCFIKDNWPCEIIEFQETGTFKANIFTTTENLFCNPISSKTLGICLADLEIFEEKIIKIDEINAKLFNIPYKSKMLLMPLIHTFF